MTTYDDTGIDIGAWWLAMPAAVFAIFCVLSFGLTQHRDELVGQNVALIVLAVAVWVRFRRLDNLVKRRR